MKILFLLVLLANLFVIMYEIKYDINYATQTSTSSPNDILEGQEQILLVNEVNTTNLDAKPPRSSQETQPNSQASAGVGTTQNQIYQLSPTRDISEHQNTTTTVNTAADKVLP